MPSEQTEAKRMLDEVRTTFESLKDSVDKRFKEIKESGYSRTETDEQITKMNEAITELDKRQKEFFVQSQRPGFEVSEEDAEKKEKAALLRKVTMKYIRHGIGESSTANWSPEEIRALQSSSDSDGGFLVPVDFETEILMDAYNEAELRPLCQVGTTGRDRVQMPALSKPIVSWGVTGIDVPEQELNAGGESISIFPLRALTLIHNDTLADTASDIEGEIRSAFSMAVAEAEDDAFAIGAGNSSPQGFMANATVLLNVTNTAVAAALSDASNNGVDALITMLHKLKKTYRRNATWAMTSTTEGVVRTLKDDNGQYLWQPAVQPGNPNILLGRGIANPEGMAEIGADAFPVGLGDFRKGYKIRDRSGIVIQRLVERYAEKDQTAFILKRRTGGQATKPEAFQVLKCST